MSQETPDPWHEKFASEYVANGGNGLQAVKKFKPELTDGSAGVAAARLLKIANVNRLIEKKLRSISQKADLNAAEVLQELKRIGMADVADAIGPDGCVKPMTEIPLALRRAISGLDVEELWGYEDDKDEDGHSKGRRKKVRIGVIKRIRFWNKVGALDLLGKNLELWIEKVKLVDNNPHSAADLSELITMLTRLRDSQAQRERA